MRFMFEDSMELHGLRGESVENALSDLHRSAGYFSNTYILLLFCQIVWTNYHNIIS